MNTEQFIAKFASENVHSLALKASKFPEVDMHFALNQIAGRQAAMKKLPLWAATEGVVYPPHISMEQCSSEFTARYKQGVLQRLAGTDYTLTDLTGGFGVDFMYMSESSSKAVYVERNTALCDTARHNASVFGRTNVEIVNSLAEDYLKVMESSDIIYADPARRDTSGARTYAISDCTPDVLELLPLLLAKARYVFIKLSPMLDHNKAVSDINSIQRCVKEVHIVSTGGECKELLLLLSADSEENYNIYCINDTSEYSFTSDETTIPPSICNDEDYAEMYLYEPNASIMKAGCFGKLTRTYNMSVMAINSNLFLSHEIIGNFPGRSFRVLCTTTMNKKELSRALSGIKKANITVRNFPNTVAELRKRLKLGDGGNTYIFATTTSKAVHQLLICEKL